MLQLAGHSGPVKAVAAVVLGNKATVASGSQDQVVKVWEVNLSKATGKCTYTLAGHTGSVEDLDVHSEGNLIISGSWDCSLKLWVLSDTNDDTSAQDATEGDRKRRKVDVSYQLKVTELSLTC